MFGKLLKYDFRSMFKQFAFIWPAALALALVNHFTLNSFVTSTSDTRQTISGVAMLVYVAILMAMFIIALVFTIQRFYKGLLGDEGYLMHTLPVRPWQLIGSKLLCAVATTFLSVLVAVASVFIIFPWDAEDYQQLFRGLQYLFSHWNSDATNALLALFETILMILVSFAAGFLQLYLAMSLGHLFNKNRVACSVVAFIALNAVMTTLLGIVGPRMEHTLNNIVGNWDSIASFHSTIWITIAVELLISAAYFAGTEFILRKKLNLE